MAEGLSDELVAKCKEEFSLFDKDCTGEITLAELGTVLRTLFPSVRECELDGTRDELEKLGDDDGTIDFPSFLRIVRRRIKDMEIDDESQTQAEVLVDGFRAHDEGKTGRVPAADIRRILGGMGLVVSEEELDGLVDRASVEGRSSEPEVDYYVFVELLASSRENR